MEGEVAGCVRGKTRFKDTLHPRRYRNSTCGSGFVV